MRQSQREVPNVSEVSCDTNHWGTYNCEVEYTGFGGEEYTEEATNVDNIVLDETGQTAIYQKETNSLQIDVPGDTCTIVRHRGGTQVIRCPSHIRK